MSGRVEHMSQAEDPRRAKARRNAWLLGALVVLFYVGLISWYILRSAQPGG